MRIGIIGFGSFAERAILPAIQLSNVAEVTAIQKRSLDAARAKAAHYGIPHAFATAEELVRCDEVDAVFIASANVSHASETIAAAKAGKHVLVEKPMAATVAQAERMVQTCRERGVTLMVGHMVRLSPVITRMKQLITDGTIGTLVHISSEFFYNHRHSHRTWLFDRKVAGGGPIHDIGVHCLDTIRFLANDDVTAVRGIVTPRPTAKETERTASVSLLFRNGVSAYIYSSFDGPYRRSFIEARGTEGTLSAFDFTKSGLQVHLHVVQNKEGEPLLARVEEVEVPYLYTEEIRLFVSAIEQGVDPPISGEEGVINQKILDLMLKQK